MAVGAPAHWKLGFGGALTALSRLGRSALEDGYPGVTPKITLSTRPSERWKRLGKCGVRKFDSLWFIMVGNNCRASAVP
jgi:hypothetical protein